MLEGNRILVVGAAGLLGAKLVDALLAQGALVVAADINLSRLTERFSTLYSSQLGNSLDLQELDLADKLSIANLFNQYRDINGAVNCSYPRNKSYGRHFYDVDIGDFNENISLNLGSAFLFMQQCAIHFNRTKSPFSLVNISSIYGVIAPKFDIYNNTPMTMPVEYSAIKSALIHLSRYVVKYVSDSNFRVNVVSPGGILDSQPNEFLEAYRKQTMGTGMLSAADVVGSIVFLLSTMSKFITGQNIIVDDGFSI